MVFNATFNNISDISWQSVLLSEETGRPRENHRPVASDWQTLSRNVVLLALIELRTHNISDYWHWLHSCKSKYHMIMATAASQIQVLNYIHQMIPEWQRCPDVTFTYRSKEYHVHSTVDLMTFHSHYKVWVFIILWLWNAEHQ